MRAHCKIFKNGVDDDGNICRVPMSDCHCKPEPKMNTKQETLSLLKQLLTQVQALEAMWNDAVAQLPEPEPALIDGLTHNQWQRIIDEGFLCEFSDIGTYGAYNYTARLEELTDNRFRAWSGVQYIHARPLRMKGHIQPWFGGERPVHKDTQVIVYIDGIPNKGRAIDFYWEPEPDVRQITSFIEL